MLARVLFVVITLFWVGMNVLLWRAEFGKTQRQSKVPLSMVFQKILNAPDASILTISRQGKQVGSVRWSVTAVEKRVEGPALDESASSPEGMVRQLGSYSMDLEGNYFVHQVAQRIRFDASMKINTNQNWEEFSVRVNLKPYALMVTTLASEKSFSYVADDGVERREKKVDFATLRDPEKLLSQLGVDDMAVLLGAALPATSLASENLKGGLQWEAYQDWMKIGHENLRVYRLEARLLERFTITIMVGRMGEILRIELPNGIRLENDRINPFG